MQFDAQRVLSRIQRGAPDDCWLWPDGAWQRDGYGAFMREGKECRVTHLVLECDGRPLQLGEDALHTCDTPACCNPRHLYAGRDLDNVRDMHDRGRARWRNGEAHAQAKLTDAQVEDIRRRYRAGGVLQRELAAEYGVRQSLISMIVNGRKRREPAGPA